MRTVSFVISSAIDSDTICYHNFRYDRTTAISGNERAMRRRRPTRANNGRPKKRNNLVYRGIHPAFPRLFIDACSFWKTLPIFAVRARHRAFLAIQSIAQTAWYYSARPLGPTSDAVSLLAGIIVTQILFG